MAYNEISFLGVLMSAKGLPGKVERRSKPFRFDLATSHAIQEAERYERARVAFLFVSALAVVLCFITEIDCLNDFVDWLPEHLWTSAHGVQVAIEGSCYLVLAFLTLFGIAGVVSVYSQRQFKGIRVSFFWISFALVLPPIYMRERTGFNLIILSGFLSLLCLGLARWAGNQRPHDRKIIIAEKSRLNWGPLEFAIALTRGRASDGQPLAFVSNDSSIDPMFPIPKERDDRSVSYRSVASVLTLTLKQRYPWSNVAKNWKALIELLEASGCTEEEHEQLSRTWLFVHSEIEERVDALIGNWRERG